MKRINIILVQSTNINNIKMDGTVLVPPPVPVESLHILLVAQGTVHPDKKGCRNLCLLTDYAGYQHSIERLRVSYSTRHALISTGTQVRTHCPDARCPDAPMPRCAEF